MTRPSLHVSHWILGGLALLMFITRAQPVEHFLELPDASWAVFFIAGFYLRGRLASWAFPALMLEAVAIDWIATQHLGVSDFCMTPAYWFLLPTHAVMWAGGHLLRRQEQVPYQGGASPSRPATGHASGAGREGEAAPAHALFALALLAFGASTLAYTISNGGFYWFGGRYPDPNVGQYLERFAMYYRWFVLVPCAYIAAAAFVHIGVTRALRAPTGGSEDAR